MYLSSGMYFLVVWYKSTTFLRNVSKPSQVLIIVPETLKSNTFLFLFHTTERYLLYLIFIIKLFCTNIKELPSIIEDLDINPNIKGRITIWSLELEAACQKKKMFICLPYCPELTQVGNLVQKLSWLTRDSHILEQSIYYI